MKKVAIYIRVSTDQQKTDLQVKDLAEYAERREFEIYKVYDDLLPVFDPSVMRATPVDA